jgi:hypothetical protein
MTLKEKFEEVFIKNWLSDYAIECEKIAEKFAINFANWYEFTLRESDNLNQRFTPKELIEMFKKEKGL